MPKCRTVYRRSVMHENIVNKLDLYYDSRLSTKKKNMKESTIVSNIEAFLKPIEYSTKQKIQNFIRNSLSGTNRRTTPDNIFNIMKRTYKNISLNLFKTVWDEMISDGYLIQAKGSWTWKT